MVVVAVVGVECTPDNSLGLPMKWVSMAAPRASRVTVCVGAKACCHDNAHLWLNLAFAHVISNSLALPTLCQIGVHTCVKQAQLSRPRLASCSESVSSFLTPTSSLRENREDLFT